MQSQFYTIDNSILYEKFLNQFCRDIDSGLSSCPKKIPSQYFYDETGSDLFRQITELPEYYLTKCEQEIILDNSLHIVEIVLENCSKGMNLVEFGAGDTEKPFPLIEQILKNPLVLKYIAIDISHTALNDLSHRVSQKFLGLNFQGLNMEYFEALSSIDKRNNNRNFLLFLGSNIGNFNYEQKIDFLSKMKSSLNSGDWLLIGFDLKKHKSILLPAYDDASGITRQFNLNLLTRINRELGGNFNLNNFSHFSRYDVVSGAMESYLVSHCAKEVYIKQSGRSYEFTAGESIHTESSHKYDLNDIQNLAAISGFKIRENFYDSKKYFICSLWKVP